MKRFRLSILAAATALALTGCHGSKVEESAVSSNGTTTIAKTSDVNGQVTKSALVFKGYAMRAALGVNPDTAAYVTVTNTGSTADRLVSAACACAARATLHTTTRVNGMVQMNEVTGFDVAPGQTLVFAPGGNHIMLEGLTVRPKDGDTQDVVLTFAKAGPVTLRMPVQNAPAAGSDDMAGMKM